MPFLAPSGAAGTHMPPHHMPWPPSLRAEPKSYLAQVRRRPGPPPSHTKPRKGQRDPQRGQTPVRAESDWYPRARDRRRYWDWGSFRPEMHFFLPRSLPIVGPRGSLSLPRLRDGPHRREPAHFGLAQPFCGHPSPPLASSWGCCPGWRTSLPPRFPGCSSLTQAVRSAPQSQDPFLNHRHPQDASYQQHPNRTSTQWQLKAP